VESKALEGAPHKVWNTDVAVEKFMTRGSWRRSSARWSRATISERATSPEQVHPRWHQEPRTIELDDFGVAVAACPRRANWDRISAVRAGGRRLEHPWSQRASTGSIRTQCAHIHVIYGGCAASLLDEEVDAGQRTRIAASFEPVRGPDTVRDHRVTMAPEARGDDASGDFAPAGTSEPDLAAPENLAALIANAPRQTCGVEDLWMAQYRVPSQGLRTGDTCGRGCRILRWMR